MLNDLIVQLAQLARHFKQFQLLVHVIVAFRLLVYPSAEVISNRAKFLFSKDNKLPPLRDRSRAEDV